MKKSFLIIILIVCQFNVFSQTKFYSSNEYQFNVDRTIPLKDGFYQYYYIFQTKDTLLRAEGEIVNDKKQGFWNIYDFGKRHESFYVDGVVHGLTKSFYESGKLESIKTNWNKKENVSIWYHENGQIGIEHCDYYFKRYYPNGQIESEEIYYQDSSNLTYNSIGLCWDAESGLQIMLGEKKEYLGNEWYENGNKKVSCKLVKRNPYTLEITQSDSLERKIIVGKMEHSTRDYVKCFYFVGDWIYYKANGEIEKKIAY